MKIMRYLVAFILSLCVPLAWSTDRPDNYPMAAFGRLVVDTEATALRVRGHDLNTLVIERSPGHPSLTPRGDEQEWHLDLTGMTDAEGPDEVSIVVPLTASLEIRSESAALSVEGLRGRQLRVFNAAGSTKVHDSRPEMLEIESVQGRQDVDKGGRQSSRLRSVSGSIIAVDLGGRASLSTVTGELNLRATHFDELDIDTVSGAVSAELHPGEHAVVRLTSHDGPLNLLLPESISLDARVQSYSGELSSDFQQAELAPGTWRVSQGSGSVSIQARSFSAPISLRAGSERPDSTVLALVYRPDAGPVELAEFGHDQHVDLRLRAGEYALLALPTSADLIYVRGATPGSLPKHGRYELGVERWGHGLHCFEIQPSHADMDGAWIVAETSRAQLIARHFVLAHGPCPSVPALADLRQVEPY